MKFIKLVFTLLIIAAIGGFIALGFIDIPIEQQEVTTSISLDELSE